MMAHYDNYSAYLYMHMLARYNTCIYPPVSYLPSGLVVRISRSHRDGRGSIPRLGNSFFPNILDFIKKLYMYFRA